MPSRRRYPGTSRVRTLPSVWAGQIVRRAVGFLLLTALAGLVSCGQVITPEPTAPNLPVGPQVAASTPTARGTAAPLILPPVATATPTLTPTPVIHTVIEGDVLLGIAYQYGVSVAALQSANGIENPQFLQIGQKLAIPVGQEDEGAVPGSILPTSTPLHFSMQGVECYETPVGSLHCLGEVINTTADTLANVQLRIILFDANGELLVEADAYAIADLVPPGAKSPFGFVFVDPPLEWASQRVGIIGGGAAGALVSAYVPIAIDEVEAQPAGPQFRVHGIASNASADQTASSVAVIATVYDAGGLVTGYRQEDLEFEEPLEPGGVTSFDLLFGYYGDGPADFSVIALGRVSSQ